ncbi:FecR family protein [Paremcibacter congregatus]|uniref:FecR family protein n=1 Tax=Paremcibacter congregatus TaxID=2043170 RepID=UPI003A92B134
MTQLSERHKAIIDEASEWVTKLDGAKLSASEQQAFAEWLTMSKEHIQEFLFAAATFQALGDIEAPERVTIDQLLAEKAPDVIPLFRDTENKAAEPNSSIIGKAGHAAGKPAHEPQKQPVWKKMALIAATIAFVVISASSYLTYNNGLQDDAAPLLAYHTDVGEQRSIPLSDGSVIYLNTNSRVSVAYLENERKIELLEGEALFKVAHNPERPFRVYSGLAVAEALGTTFNVYRENGRTNVAVVEGKVSVSAQSTNTEAPLNGPGENAHATTIPQEATATVQPLLLTSGQKSGLDKDEGFLPVQSVQPELITSWRERRLVFEQEQLATIAREFNRYNKVKLVIEDENLNTIEFDGVFDADDPEAFVQFLKLTGDIEARQVSNREIRLRKAGSTVTTDQKI